tara:strand:- start:25 stop:564 length:540 start_codon:yes stop_codon:yes gene_type:complete
MNSIFRLFLRLFFAIVCVATSHGSLKDDLRIAEKFLDEFYKFNPVGLKALLKPGEDAAQVLYYQAWAEAAHYRVKQRSACVMDERQTIICAITVTDDFGLTMGYEATDTFSLKVVGNKISAVSFKGDDPPIFKALFEWISRNRAEILKGPCKDLFDGGKTPAACSTAVVGAAKAFMAGP